MRQMEKSQMLTLIQIHPILELQHLQPSQLPTTRTNQIPEAMFTLTVIKPGAKNGSMSPGNLKLF